MIDWVRESESERVREMREWETQRVRVRVRWVRVWENVRVWVCVFLQRKGDNMRQLILTSNFTCLACKNSLDQLAWTSHVVWLRTPCDTRKEPRAKPRSNLLQMQGKKYIEINMISIETHQAKTRANQFESSCLNHCWCSSSWPSQMMWTSDWREHMWTKLMPRYAKAKAWLGGRETLFLQVCQHVHTIGVL